MLLISLFIMLSATHCCFCVYFSVVYQDVTFYFSVFLLGLLHSIILYNIIALNVIYIFLMWLHHIFSCYLPCKYSCSNYLICMCDCQ